MSFETQFRAVFWYPTWASIDYRDTFGPPRSTVKETEQDLPIEPEVTGGRRNGTQTRVVSDRASESPTAWIGLAQ